MGAHCHAAIREKGECGSAKPHVAGHVAGQGKSIKRIGQLVGPERAHGGDDLWPTLLATLETPGWVGQFIL